MATLYPVEEVCFCSEFAGHFYHEWMLNYVKCFSESIEMNLRSRFELVKMVNSISSSWILSQPCFPGMNSPWSQGINLFMHCWIWFGLDCFLFFVISCLVLVARSCWSQNRAGRSHSYYMFENLHCEFFVPFSSCEGLNHGLNSVIINKAIWFVSVWVEL